MSLKNHVMQAVGLALLAIPVILAMPTQAQDAVEEIVVTGSYIKHSPEDAPVPIDVIDSEELFNTGNPSVVELVKTLGVSSGVDGETNQFSSNGLEGTANVNLRGLGAGRNLVLLNGRRNVFSPYPVAEQQQLFVDINMIPGVALDRVELLKDGAAATYGSDAISGVVNFITRSDFEGLEFALSHKEIQDSDGDQDFGVIWGQDFGRTHVMAAFGYAMRNQLRIRDRDWAISPFRDKGIIRSYSLSPNPGGFLDFRTYRAGPDGTLGNTDDPSLTGIAASALKDDGLIDPFCGEIAGEQNLATLSAVSAFLGGALDNRCTYNYTYFDNLIEEEERSNLYATLTHEFADNMQLNIEFLYGQNEVPEWHTSPSYPPQVNFDTRVDTGRYIYADHPGLVEFAKIDLDAATAGVQNGFADYAAACDASSDGDDCRRLLFYGRPFGSSGPATIGSREYETTRIVVGLEGEFDNGVDYITSLLWSEAQGERKSFDVLSERWSESLRGYGVCGIDAEGTLGGTAGVGDCEYYNPFSNAIRVSEQKYAVYTAENPNPNYPNETNGLDATPGAGIVNSDRLREWLFEPAGTTVDQSLTVADAVFTGEGGNGVGWALGAQWREASRTVTPNSFSNLNFTPCQSDKENIEFRTAGRTYNPDGKNCAGEDGIFADDTTTTEMDESADNYTGSGPFYFLGGTTPFDGEQTVVAVFGELAVPASDNVELQISARYEDYGGEVGDTFDPKVAVRWQVMDELVLRGSASSTFRGPTLNQLGGRTTTLSFVSGPSVYKAIDTFGDPNLEPETADSVNLGVVFDNDTFTFGLDFWSFKFDNPIIVESFNAVIDFAFSGPDGVFNSNAEPYASRITCAGACDEKTEEADLERVKVNIMNGPSIETDGFDLAFGYTREIGAGDLDINLQWTRVSSYDVGASDLAPAFSALGKVNNTVSYLRPVVQDKAKLGFQYSLNSMVFNLVGNYTSDYVGNYSGTPYVTDSHITYDLHYNMSLENMGDNLAQTAVWVSIYNLTDEDPPLTPLDLNYDPYTHNPFGQMVKVGVRHKF
ncbi:MAG: TonB-dependent receptor domain-containing protein [Gammaproteobacteria bacterium]